MEILLIAGALFLAFSNGANDNFKGFATVWGSDTLSYRAAIMLATVATLAGSLSSLWLAHGLAQQFSGQGLIPDGAAHSLHFLSSVALAAALTVWLATRLGLPVSTTHALIGGLVGAALALPGGDIHYSKLATSFLLPLISSPLLAATLGGLIHPFARRLAARSECACVLPVASMTPWQRQSGALGLLVAAEMECATLPSFASRFSTRRLADALHVLSGALICYARGVNDTPKMMALLLAAQALDARLSLLLVAAAIALGGIGYARRVAETMSRRVSRLDNARGLAANLITASLVLFASRLGLPVSTTHVAVGAIAGVGAASRGLDAGILRKIALSWLATLPLAGVIAWLVAHAL